MIDSAVSPKKTEGTTTETRQIMSVVSHRIFDTTKSIKYRQIIKLITQIEANLRDESIKSK